VSLGEIRFFGGTTSKLENWAACNGALLSIADQAELFALIGNTYGGDGTTTFALPNLTNNYAVHTGNGYSVGAAGTAPCGLSSPVTLTSLIALTSSDDSMAYTGEIRTFSFDYTPVGWIPCDGRQLNIAKYPALYDLMGTMYGSTANTFALPNFELTTAPSTGSGIGYLRMNFCICNSGPPPE
jgi:microcystin-dependent protein